MKICHQYLKMKGKIMKQKILSKIKENGLVAVVRGTDDINAVEISEKIIELSLIHI